MDLKRAFIQKALNDYMNDVERVMVQRITKYKAVHTGTLKDSPTHTVQESGSMGGEAKLLFTEYGRFIDMGVNKSNPLGGAKEISAALQQQSQKNKGIKPRKIYSPVAYGKLNGLIGDLLFGFTDETIDLLKQTLQHGNTNSIN